MPIPVLKKDFDLADRMVSGAAYSLASMIGNAIAAERERCAQVAEHLNGWGKKPNPELAEHIAKIIRQG